MVLLWIRWKIWQVITKLVRNCKDDVQLIKMFNFSAVVIFIRILISRLVLMISEISQNYSFSCLLLNQIIKINFWLNNEIQKAFFNKFIKYFFYSSSGILSLSILKSVLISSLDSTSCFPWCSTPFIYFLTWSSIVFVCFSKAFPKGD